MRISIPSALVTLSLGLWVLGCNQSASSAKDSKEKSASKEDHGHDHPSHGPHDGDLIELGNEEYHAELIHDEKTSDVTIYILDSSATKAVSIAAAEVVINVKHDGKPEQHKLVADSQEGDESGKSSRFVSRPNEDLAHALDEDGADARLQLSIDGKSYSGRIDHKHGHDHSHDHDHDKK